MQLFRISGEMERGGYTSLALEGVLFIQPSTTGTEE
jgi:hypothetical protein